MNGLRSFSVKICDLQIANFIYNILYMSKIVVIGDIHGRAIWRNIIEANADADKFIFLGDYFDSHEKKYHAQRQHFNFKSILELQEELGENKVILLLGNHDYHYYDSRERYSGYSPFTHMAISEDLKQSINNGKIKIIHIEDGVLYSHAGVSRYWLENISNVNELDKLNTDEFDIRTLRWNDEKGDSGYGDTISNSPIWIRPYSLIQDKIEGYKHVVGHTTVFAENFDNFIKIGEEHQIYVNDLLPNYYMIVENGEISYKKIMFSEKKFAD